MAIEQFRHVSVMLDEVLNALDIKEDGIYVDGTVGGAGHAYELCARLSGEGRFLGIDQDKDAVRAATERLKPFVDRARVVRDNYDNYEAILRECGIKGVDGVLLDLGVSSHQLDTAERGFSYRVDAPLDMRMDDRKGKTARDVVNEYTERDLFRIIRNYGEDRFAKNIAKHIVMARAKEPIETTGKLVEVVTAAIPAKVRRTSGHPAKRTFQAIRIECNGELDVLSASLRGMVESLNRGGRMCVITFHSLEDRIVKEAFREYENPCTCPSQFPVCVCGKKPLGRVVTRKPTIPSEEEVEKNKRAKSAKLRVFEKA